MVNKILITGAGGFIADNLSNFLNKKGFDIYGIGTRKKTQKSFKQKYKKKIVCKITCKNLVKNFNSLDFIIHCAGSGTDNLNYKKNYQNNFLTTKHIVEFCLKEKKMPIIIFMSSYSLYKDSKLNSFAITENFKIKPKSSYAKSKKKSEDLLLKFSKSHGLKIKILRLSSVYGVENKKQLLFDSCKKILNNHAFFLGSGNETRDWININDVSTLVYKIIKKRNDSNTIINCGFGKSYKVNHVIKLIKKYLKSNVNISFCKNQNLKSPKNLSLNINLAKSYGWRPKITLRKGLFEYVNWYKSTFCKENKKKD